MLTNELLSFILKVEIKSNLDEISKNLDKMSESQLAYLLGFTRALTEKS